jgi:large repetitive protein
MRSAYQHAGSKQRLAIRIALATIAVTSVSSAAFLLSQGSSAPTVGVVAAADIHPQSAAPLVTVNASHYTADCAKFTGKATLSPGLTIEGTTTAKQETAKLTGTFTNCSVTPATGGAAVKITSGKVSGSLVLKSADGSANSCGSVLGGSYVPLAGKLTITWSTSPAIATKTSVVTVKTEDSDPPEAALAQTYAIPGDGPSPVTVTGSFAGTNSGKTSVIQFIGKDTSEQLGEDCLTKSGVTSDQLTNGFIYLGDPASSVTITPGRKTIATGTSNAQYLIPSATLPDGVSIPLGDFPTLSALTSDDNSIAEQIPGSDDLVEGINPGETTIGLSFGGVTGTADVQVVDPLTLTTTSLPGGNVGDPYDQNVSADGGTSPYTFVVGLGSLPTGLTMSSSGAITGELSQAGCFDFTIEVTDSSWTTQSDDQDFQIGVSNGTEDGCLQVTSTSLPNGTEGSSYEANLTASGGTEPYSWSDEYDDLPSWATLSSSGEITGVPNQTGQFCFVALATDSSSPQQSASQDLCGTIEGSS